MPTTEKLRARLINKLKVLFQLDQPDLDFGFYKIMHAKANRVMAFLENDLLNIVEQAFAHSKDSALTELRDKYEQEVATAHAYGATNPEGAPRVKEAWAAYKAAQNRAHAEGEVYDHLYRFFERYYDEGDFLSRRYDVRETDGKAAPYAIPYSGEEVKLVWANMDQYYIKTTEYFNRFTVDLRKAVEVLETSRPSQEISMFENSGLIPADDRSMKVHFCLVDASEGEHGNIKANDATKRYFIIHKKKPVELNAQGELVVNFEYRHDPEKKGQDAKWRERRNEEAVKSISQTLKKRKEASEYLRLLSLPAPTSSQKDRTLLAKYINQYTSRNTRDYFIHKNLGGFLRRELDFYIKNEVMHLDDIESADAPAVEVYLDKIKVLRSISNKLIDFLAQLEDFQKKLWLKKKFVVETNYCITLDRIPEKFYPEIAANDRLREEWVELFAIDEIKGDIVSPGYSRPLTVEFLKANPHLILDTHLVPETQRTELLAAIRDIDEDCNGLLVHSDNFQALSLLETRYQQQVGLTYIDPPYNTVHSEIIYKNQYKHSTWLSLLANVLNKTIRFWRPTFSLGISIDDYEFVNLAALVDTLLPGLERSVAVVNHHPQGSGGRLSRTHEYLILCSPSGAPAYLGRPVSDYQEDRNFMRSGTAENNFRHGRWKSFYALLVDPKTNRVLDAEPPVEIGQKYPTGNTSEGYKRIYPINSRGEERVWRSSYLTGRKRAHDGELYVSPGGTVYQTIDHGGKRELLFSNWVDSQFNAGTHGANLLNAMDLGGDFDYPKSIYTMEVALWAQSFGDLSVVVLDYFAGSGTTAHAVINLNREDDGDRKYVLVEMGDYFDTVLIPRIKKAVYSEDWKDGKPVSRNGISHMFKYMRLESYEDTLNNLITAGPSEQISSVLDVNDSLREDYMLRYMLDVETRNSQSLLNLDAFTDPTAYTFKIKKPGSDEYEERSVDLLETFNYLLGLRVTHIAAPETFSADFKRATDSQLPKDQKTKLILNGRMHQGENGPWWFRQVEGWVPANTMQPNDGMREKVLIIWRKLTGDIERDNLMLDEWFARKRPNPHDREYDVIYINGSNNLANCRLTGEDWKVRLIEEDFTRLMWDTQGV